jgi:hypothetical protein
VELVKYVQVDLNTQVKLKKITNPQLLASGSEKKKKQSIIASSVALICWLLEMAQERALIIIVFPFVFLSCHREKIILFSQIIFIFLN